jgi:hypothetical protein
VDPELERIVNKATGSAPEDRHASADELRLELEQYLTKFPPVNLREIGELLAEASAEARAARQRELTEAIAFAERDPGSAESVFSHSDSGVSSISPPSAITSVEIPHTGSSSTISRLERSASGSRADLGPRKRRALFVVLVLATLGLALLAWAPTLFSLSPKVAEAPKPPSAVVEPRVPDPAPPAQVASAQSLLAEQASPPPASETAEPAQSSRSAAVSKDKHSKTRIVAPPKVSVPAPSAPAKVDCDPPYYFSAGIKTYKPECL